MRVDLQTKYNISNEDYEWIEQMVIEVGFLINYTLIVYIHL